MKIKIVIYLLTLLFVVTLSHFYTQVVYPEISTSLTLEKFADPSMEVDTSSRIVPTDITPHCCVVFALFGLFLFRKEIVKLKMKKSHLLLFVALVLPSTGCLKPYHEKMLVNIGTSEIAILAETINGEGQAITVPLGKGDNQKEDGSLVDYYIKRVINGRKVEIPYYWKQTSRKYLWDSSSNGGWQAAARLIVVDTKPETREWTSSLESGSSQIDQAIWVESSDSVGFSTGVSITSRINDKDDAILFLSNYPPESKRLIETKGGSPFNVEITSLAQIMDEEVRTKIQEIFAYEAAAYTMDELRGKKREILDKIKEDVIPYFKKRGITITTIGQFGGFTYENPDIQSSIDKVFQAQQEQEVAKAEAKAAQEMKLALQLKGEGTAQQAIEIAKGQAEGVKLKAEAEAEAIKHVADAKAYELEKLQENPEAYLSLKSLEIEMARLESWDGKYPHYLFQGGNGELPTLLMSTPKE